MKTAIQFLKEKGLYIFNDDLPIIIMAMEEYSKQESEEKDKRIKELQEALRKIQRWELPSTGRFWDDNPDRPISYESEYGSNGARDFIRSIATKALNPPTDGSK